jgi:hypothetical protein
MLTPAEIAALLALPPAVAVALERCPGPGWSVSDASADLHPENPWPDGHRGRTWCPVDVADLLRTAAVLQCPSHPITTGVALSLEPDGWQARMDGVGPVVAPTARLAALRLLALIPRPETDMHSPAPFDTLATGLHWLHVDGPEGREALLIRWDPRTHLAEVFDDGDRVIGPIVLADGAVRLHKWTVLGAELVVRPTFGQGAAAPDLLAALEEIAKGESAYSRDPLTHATNVIESMKAIAEAAIARAKGSAP